MAVAARSWLLAVGWALLPTSAHAEPRTPIVWDAPAGCPTVEQVRARIERRMSAEASATGISITVVHDHRSYVARVTVAGATDRRTLTSAKCSELADAVAVVVARLASERAQLTEPTTPPNNELGFVAATPIVRSLAIAPRVEAVAPPARPRAGAWGAGVRLLGLSGIGMMPRVGLGAEAAGYVRHNDWYGELGYARWLASSAYLTDGAPGHVVVGLSMVNARGGWASRRMPLRVWLGIEVGEMTGTGVALLQPQVGEGRWTAIASGLGVGWPIATHVRLVGTFELAAPVQRARFLLGDGTEIYQPSSASARCALGFEIGWR